MKRVKSYWEEPNTPLNGTYVHHCTISHSPGWLCPDTRREKPPQLANHAGTDFVAVVAVAVAAPVVLKTAPYLGLGWDHGFLTPIMCDWAISRTGPKTEVWTFARAVS